MASFAYIARSQTGDEVTGVLGGGSMDEVVDKLHLLGLAVLYVDEKREGEGWSAWKEKLRRLNLQKTSTKDLALFSRQLATVLESGIPISKGLRGLATDSSNHGLGKTIGDVCTRIESGESLSEAMSAHPESFGKMYLSMIKAGERAGTLDQIVEHLAIYLEKTDAIKTQIRSAMSYPIFILLFAIMASVLLLLKIVPTFAQLYSDLGSDLPALTQFLIDASDAIRSNIVISVSLVGALVSAFIFGVKTRRGRYLWDNFKIKMPLFGPIVRKSVMSRFTRTFGILLKSGLPILEGLDLVGSASGNAVVEDAIVEVKGQMEGGLGLTESFRSTRKFPEMVLQLMATGEEAGGLDIMLQKTSDFYDREVEAAVHSISTLIEPVMIVVVGLILGVMVLGMFMPIFTLGEAVMQGGYGM